MLSAPSPFRPRAVRPRPSPLPVHAMPRTTPLLAVTLLLGGAAVASAQLPDVDDTFDFTATDGGGLARGDARTLTWAIVGDGTPITPGVSGEGNAPSNLIQFLDANVGSSAINGATNVVSQKDWFRHFESYHDRYSQLSGLSYDYVAYDPGDDVRTFQRGSLGTRADVRIGGHLIDGNSGILAYNYFPSGGFGGNMVIDTGDSNFYSNAANDYRGLRNVLAHEHGHGLGQPHYFADAFVTQDGQTGGNFRGLMEPFVDTNFDGPQIVDILQTQRGYGDVLEKAGGNDTLAAANVADLGTLTVMDDVIELGYDAAQLIVDPADTGFFSIDGLSDTDFYEFTVDALGTVNLLLEPLGLTVTLDLQNPSTGGRQGSPEVVDLSALANLNLALFDGNGLQLAFTDAGGLGDSESLSMLLDAGTYFARIDSGDANSGRPDAAQFYGLTLDFVGAPSAVPEPGTWALLLFAAGGAAARRRRSRTVAAAA